MRGEMLWFNEAKSYGFIETEDGERLYVHSSGFAAGAPAGRCAGLPVALRLVVDDLGRRAVDVSFVDDTAARRARPRRGVRG
jgi:cold shock CspA family protein